MRKPHFQKVTFLGILVVILSFFFVCAFDVRLRTVNYTVETNKVTKPIRIALITDLHSCKYGKGQRVLIKAIKKQNPDIVLLGGDICDDRIPHDNTKLLLKEIANKYPCFYVSGNHEYWSGEIDEIKSIISSFGVKVLEGDCEKVVVNNQIINISGIDDPEEETYKNNKNAFYSQLETCERKVDKRYFHILLAHRPQYIKTYLEYGFNLVLSGHAHGGQWRIPGFLNGLYAPDQEWFPKYAGGLYELENGKMIVSRGLSRESTRVPRIFNRPELVIIDISPISIT